MERKIVLTINVSTSGCTDDMADCHYLKHKEVKGEFIPWCRIWDDDVSDGPCVCCKDHQEAVEATLNEIGTMVRQAKQNEHIANRAASSSIINYKKIRETQLSAQGYASASEWFCNTVNSILAPDLPVIEEPFVSDIIKSKEEINNESAH